MRDFARFHKNRVDAETRDRLAQAVVGPDNFVQGLFVVSGSGILRPVPGLPGTAHVSVDKITEAVAPFLAAGVNKVLLFGVCDAQDRDATGSASRAPDALVPAAVRRLKAAFQDLVVITDVCLCAYTDHGHCGVLNSVAAKGTVGRTAKGPERRGAKVSIDNDATLPFLAAMAAAHAEAGADWVAPSAMMDGQVAAIREALDAREEKAGAVQTDAGETSGTNKAAGHTSGANADKAAAGTDKSDAGLQTTAGLQTAAGPTSGRLQTPAVQSPPKTKILGYSAKFASAFYGPFRGAADSAPSFGDRRTYQMDPRNGDEAMAEIAADLDEGADGVMVKPAGAYLDVLARARAAWPDKLLAAYQTSGDIMTLRAAARAGILDYSQALAEQLVGIRRAGADWILGYSAADYLGIAPPWGIG